MTITGAPLDRVDGRLKVCGRATFAAEFTLPGMAHAVLVTSTIASGRIAAIDTAAATALPGVIAVLTPANAPRLPQGGRAAVDPPAGRVLALLQDDAVAYDRQPIAVVVADTIEHAADAARKVRTTYARLDAALDFDRAKARAYPPARANREPTDHVRGDLAAGLAAADARVDAVYTTPVEHHNPLEPHATLASWDGEKLTVHDSTQNVGGSMRTLAKTFGIPVENVAVVSPYVGGGFGCKGSSWSHVALAALAARHVGRPVRLVLERPQMFGPVGNRPRTEQTLRLGAAGGRLTAIGHASISETSMIEDWVETSAIPARMLYACPNVASTHRIAKLNVGTPTFDRAPGEASGNFALESALDELAYAAKIDPLELRLRNYAEQDPAKGKPFSSKSLRACYAEGAKRFGWSTRDPRPGVMRDGPWRVGYGMATATYPTNRSAAEASVRIGADGIAVVQCATHELGTGTYTVMSQVAADAIGLPVSRIRFECGDSRLPPSPGAGGSQSAASVSPAVQAAGAAARRRLIEIAVADAQSFAHGIVPDRVAVVDGWLRPLDTAGRPAATGGEPVAVLVARHGRPVEARDSAKPGAEREAYSMHAFGAVYAEVRVDADLGVIRVPRIVGVYGVGRRLNEKTAHSQLLGGIVWGVSMALHEASHRDPRYGRIVNANLAEYHVPVNADIGAVEIAFVDEDDPHVNPLGVKGIGEIGITGVAAAIANAVFHATGRRVRELPVTLDKLI